MTYITGEISEKPSDAKRHRQSKGEYRLYFGLIFVAALLSCTVIWAYSLIRHSKFPEQGPIRRALSEARTITPRIFWA